MTKIESNLGAYLDSYFEIRLVIPFNTKYSNIYLQDNDTFVLLEVKEKKNFEDRVVLILISTIKIKPFYDYYVKVNEDLVLKLLVGRITLTYDFDIETFYEGCLGIKYYSDKVIFRLWAPVSKEVILVIDDDKKFNLNRINESVYETSISNENEWLDKKSYYYLIRNDLEFIKVLDPYAYAVNSSLDRCFIFDPNKTFNIKNSYINNSLSNIIIYEINIRDFTISLPIKHSGEFLGIINASKLANHGINYLKNLGITHVQLMPVFAFGGVGDYLFKDSKNSKFSYNWGYNPVLYNSLCGWYASNPNDPYCVVNEFKMLVDALHKENIGVNLDVVYNHVYDTYNYSLNKIVPNYPYRFFNDSSLSNGSWCGNDIATERKMNQKFIIDSLKYFQKNFKIDGFRFDLMGLIDKKTLILAKEELKKVNQSVLLYGEGWQMNTAYPSSMLATMNNYLSLNEIGFFNDEFRNFLRNNDLNLNLINIDILKKLFNGTIYFEQSVNYVECHDNKTFYDQQKILGLSDNRIKENAKFCFVFILFSKGISFIHSGQEVLRSKTGIDNSYNQSDSINKFPWHLTLVHIDLIEYVKSLIKIKKDINFDKYDLFKIELDNEVYKVIFKNNNSFFNLYLNFTDLIKTIKIDNESILFGNEINGIVKLNRNVLITKS